MAKQIRKLNVAMIGYGFMGRAHSNGLPAGWALFWKKQDTIATLATAAVSRTLLKQVTESIKRMFTIHYESAEEIGHSPEWQEINKLFDAAVNTYVGIAMNNRRKMHGDLLLWVKTQVEANESAISRQHLAATATATVA